MKFRGALMMICAVAAAGCSKAVPQTNAHGPAPMGALVGGPAGDADAEPVMYPDINAGPVPLGGTVMLLDLPLVDTNDLHPRQKLKENRHRLISEEEAARLQAEARALPPQPGVQVITDRATNPLTLATSFDSLKQAEGGGGTPPDPEMAVGPNHVIAMVNSALEVYDRTGVTLAGPLATDTFFGQLPNGGCSGTFDPNVLYDEKADRFFMGIDSSAAPTGGSDNGYCFAVSMTSDPLGSWYLYSFDASANAGDFFDYPHAGIGEEAIFMGANVFGTPFHADVWAINKAQAYAGQAVTIVRQQMASSNGTPQPMNAHGFAQGTWPSGNTHYILSDKPFDGTSLNVTAWTDPFGANTFTELGVVDLNTASGVTGGYPLDVPQAGSAVTLAGNDWRPQDAEYRNGRLWMSHTIACNPGGGTVNCVRWAEIDPSVPSIVQSGVFASDGEFRTFADLAVNHCNDVLMGYTKSSTGKYPSVYYTGRMGSDPAGTMGSEGLLWNGTAPHTTTCCGETSPIRWGDYSGATPDPDGVGMWYLGEYGAGNNNWSNFIGHFSTSCSTASGAIFSDGFETGGLTSWSSWVN